jgi:HK97 family phage prohead protease
METRSVVEFRALGGRKIGGYAAVFNQLSEDLGGFVERVLPGAFQESLASGRDVFALHAHKPELILGRLSASTLRLATDQRGLSFEIDLPRNTQGNDVLESVSRGDLKGASFAFKVPNNGDRWTQDQGKSVRELMVVELHEISITADPAYPDTTVAKRALSALVAHSGVTLARRYLELL